MIDVHAESLISLSQAAKLLPPGRSGRPTHCSTLVRWIRNGVNGPGGDRVFLEAARIGGRWVVSSESLARFATCLTPMQRGPSPVADGRAVLNRSNEHTARELARLGI